MIEPPGDLVGVIVRYMLVGAALAASAAAFVGGYEFHKVRAVASAAGGSDRLDAYGRLIEVAGRQAIPCPTQRADDMVILTIGQSNAANELGQRYQSRYGERVLSYFAGQCYIAASPLLGAGGHSGEAWTALGNKLIERGVKRVIIIPSAMGSTSIADWAQGGRMNEMLGDALASGHYRPSHVIWLQGESDLDKGTSEREYMDGFRSMLSTLRAATLAPVYVGLASRCGILRNNQPWQDTNPVRRAQLAIIDSMDVLPGPDLDALAGENDRLDGCHLAASGVEKLTDDLARRLTP